MAPIVRNGSGWRARACHGALGDARSPRMIRRCTDLQYSQCWQPALARLAWQEKPLHRASNLVLRVRRHEATQDPEVVRPRPGPPFVCLRWSMDTLARRARAKERAGESTPRPGSRQSIPRATPTTPPRCSSSLSTRKAALLIAGQSRSTSGRKSSEPSFESFCCPPLNFFQLLQTRRPLKAQIKSGAMP